MERIPYTSRENHSRSLAARHVGETATKAEDEFKNRQATMRVLQEALPLLRRSVPMKAIETIKRRRVAPGAKVSVTGGWQLGTQYRPKGPQSNPYAKKESEGKNVTPYGDGGETTMLGQDGRIYTTHKEVRGEVDVMVVLNRQKPASIDDLSQNPDRPTTMTDSTFKLLSDPKTVLAAVNGLLEPTGQQIPMPTV